MMTLQELKEIIVIPEDGMKTPSAKQLGENGRVVAKKYFEEDAWIVAYQEGYALYHAYGCSTVFLIHKCGDYLYISNGMCSFLPEQFFRNEPWYVRLVLEGEDRLEHNREVKEQGRTVSCNETPERCQVMGTIQDPVLGSLVSRENVEEMLDCLTKRQRAVVYLCLLQQKTRKEVAKELGISSPAVSAALSKATRRIQEGYPPKRCSGKAVAAV